MEEQINKSTNKQINRMNNRFFPIQLLAFPPLICCSLNALMRTLSQEVEPPSNKLSADVTGFKDSLRLYVVIICVSFL